MKPNKECRRGLLTLAPLKYEDTVLYRYLPLLEVFIWIEVRLKAKLIRVVLDLVTGR